MIYFSFTPTTFPEIIFAHQFVQENYHSIFTRVDNNNIETVYVKVGTIILTLDGCEFRVEEGSIILLPHNCNASIRTVSKDIHVHYTLNLHVCDDITLHKDAASIPSGGDKLVLPVVLGPSVHTEEICKRLNYLIEGYHKTSPERKYKCACEAFELLCDISALNKSLNEAEKLQSKHIPQIYCTRIKKYVRQNIGQPISLSDVSVFLDKSPNYLNRIFKAENGITIQQYINREKIRECVELITSQGFTLTQCCDYVGIKDPNYLSRLFKKHMGISASQFKLNSVYSTFPLVDRNKL